MALRASTQRRVLHGRGEWRAGADGPVDGDPVLLDDRHVLKHDKEIDGYEATLIPERPTFANYATVFRETPYMLYLRNSVVVAGSTLLSMIIAVLGAYAIARPRLPRPRAARARSGVHVPRAHLAALHPDVRHDERVPSHG